MTACPSCRTLGLLCVVLFYSAGFAVAQEPTPPAGDVPAADQDANADQAAAEPDADATAVDELSLSQERVAAQYQRFEEVLLRMAELTSATDPERAALLRRAVAHSKGRRIGEQLESAANSIKDDQLAAAVTDQQAIEHDLADLLQLLLSEQRGKRLKDDKERIKEEIRRIKELIKKQQQLQGQTAGGGDTQQLAPQQGRLADDTHKLADEMQKASDENNGDARPPGESPDAGDPKKPADEPPGGAEKQPDPDAEKTAEPSKPEDADAPSDPAEQAPGQPSQQPSPTQPSDQGADPSDQPPKEGSQQGKPNPGGQPPKPGEQGSQGEQDPQEGQPDQERPDGSPPAPHDRVEAARKRMEQAQEKLKQAERDGAQREQEEALRELEQARAELEEILRQLREEEIKRMLTELASRFRKILDMQQIVYEGTLQLDRVAKADRDRDDEIEAGRLSRKETLIVAEVDTTLALLRDDGSAVAFPEATSQMRDDMLQVTGWLAKADVGAETQAVEEDIIASLEEMIDALKKAQRDQEQKQQQQQQQQDPGEPEDPPLVDSIAELKLIRALQVRVNKRTQRYTELVGGEDRADKPELVQALEQLSERQSRIYRATRDIVVGKNK